MKNILKVFAVACLALLSVSCKKDDGPVVNEKACFVTLPDLKPLSNTYSCTPYKWENQLFVPFDGDKVLDNGDFVTIEISGESKALFDYMTAPADDHGLDGDAVCYGFYPTTSFKQGQYATAKIIYNDGSMKFEKEIKVIADNVTEVDLGLSVKWAPMNIGVEENPGDAGFYFAWGETVAKKTFNWYAPGDYKWGVFNAADPSKGMTKYTTGTLQPEDDPATMNWGSKWRTPTENELRELLDKSKCKWTWDKTRKGYIVEGLKTGKTIFLPAAGFMDDSQVYSSSNGGNYWSSTVTTPDPSTAFALVFREGIGISYSELARFEGMSVRAVTEY